MIYAGVVLPSFSTAKSTKNEPSVNAQNGLNFCCKFRPIFHWFWTRKRCPKSMILAPKIRLSAWSLLKTVQRLPRWLEKLANGSKTGPIGCQDAPESVQTGTKSLPRTSCDGGTDKPSMQNSHLSLPMAHFIFRISQFLKFLLKISSSILDNPKISHPRPQLSIYEFQFTVFPCVSIWQIHHLTLQFSDRRGFVIQKVQTSIHN